MSEAVAYLDPSEVSPASLCLMARQAFSETFAHLYERDPFIAFLQQAYGPGRALERDLQDIAIHWKVAAAGGKPVGYVKVSPLSAPAPSPVRGALELKQIYVLQEWQGRGVADRLMKCALDDARSRKATELYLTVFDHNVRAKRFYARYGFSEVGHCTFTLGDRVDDDRVWRKVL